MDKKTTRKTSVRKAVGHGRVVGLPFYFKQIETFLKFVFEANGGISFFLVPLHQKGVEVRASIRAWCAEV